MLNLLLRFVAALPLRAVHGIGGLLGQLVFWLSPTFRRRVRENLAIAGYLDPDLPSLAAAEAGKQALETPWVWLRPRSQVLSRVSIEPADRAVLESLLADSRPIVFLTPHLGCFEVTAQWVAAAYFPSLRRSVTVLYRVPRTAGLRKIVAEGRAAEGIVLAPANVSGVRKLMRAMKSRELVGILPDQVPSNGEGVWVPYFGRPAYTMTLPSKLARQFDGIVVLVWGERLAKGRGWRFRLKPLEESLDGDPVHDALVMNRGLEALIRQCPTQYLWGYNRYKVPAGAEPPTSQPPS